MSIDEVLWLPIVSAALCFALKVVGSATGVQRFNFRGMPSGHAAVMATLLTVLALRLPDSTNELGVAAAFTALYSSDILLFYYHGPSAKDGLPLGHDASEILVGALIGVSVALIYDKYVKPKAD